MKVLVTGAHGFIGKNLCLRLLEESLEVIKFCRDDDLSDLLALVSQADFIVHLAGINRPRDIKEFESGNVDLTQKILDAVQISEKKIPIIFTSSIQANTDNPYGLSKAKAELRLQKFARENSNGIYIYRLPNVFGKWCRPNYNSAVATFCFNIQNNIEITVHYENAPMSLVYIDDVVNDFIKQIKSPQSFDECCFVEVDPVYQTTVGDVAKQIYLFKESRNNLFTESVGKGLCRALYSTYLSYMHPKQFCYDIPVFSDERGVFSEILKTKDSGQFSFFTAGPGITRGGHYHHSKNEKFIVVKGKAEFGFRHVLTDEIYHKKVSGDKIEVVETVPGWSHDIKNIGDDELIVMLWANEVFDREQPDTIFSKV